ncbi:acylphosphatase [Rhodovulum sp. YNF3179]|uniref:acylphosphatase n=1 Tax=Rhodovulum sp. YNF3179 TaxID=3425127 RepID=UPI003D3590D9
MTENTQTAALSARITGRVQGVAFRAWTQAEAERRGLSGWVRNDPDGAVTALFAGPRAAVEEMALLLWQGPGAAAVAHVATAPADPAEAGDSFRITG